MSTTPFLSVQDGKFVLSVGSQTFRTSKPTELMAYMDKFSITCFLTSSSVDFPSEYGMRHQTVRRFFALVEARQAENEHVKERCLTPLVYRVQRASNPRPRLKAQRKLYITQAPCAAATFDQKTQWWELKLNNLLDLQDLQREDECPVQLLNGVLTIQDQE